LVEHAAMDALRSMSLSTISESSSLHRSAKLLGVAPTYIGEPRNTGA
jgi:hypothetical protein